MVIGQVATKQGPVIRKNKVGTVFVFGYDIDTICANYKNGFKEFIDYFERQVKAQSLATRLDVINVIRSIGAEQVCQRLERALADAEIVPLNDSEPIEGEVIDNKPERSIWIKFAVKPNMRRDDYFGEYDEIYIEHSNLDEIDEFVAFIWATSPFRQDLFTMTIYDGREVAKRAIFNSTATYRVYDKDFVLDRLNMGRQMTEAYRYRDSEVETVSPIGLSPIGH